MLQILFFGLVFVKFTLFKYVEIAYLSKTVRETDSLSSVQSVNLIARFSSNESLQYPRDGGVLLVPDLFSIKSAAQDVLYVITKIITEN